MSSGDRSPTYPTPAGGVSRVANPVPVPAHLASWTLPPRWRWGRGSARTATRHAQEIIDALGRSLSLVSTPLPEHHEWLAAEARFLAHQSHPAIPTTYHYWTNDPGSPRGPGYLRRWIAGETIRDRIRRQGPEDVPAMLNVLRTMGTALVYLHDQGQPHGAISPASCWMTPTGRLWLLGWEWALPATMRPADVAPSHEVSPRAPEMGDGFQPTTVSDQWQLGALAFTMLTGEQPPHVDPPPLALVRPDCPARVAAVLDQALDPDPAARHGSTAALLRALERVASVRTGVMGVERVAPTARRAADQEETRLRWATGDDYEVLARLGSGTFGIVWRVRDLSLQREVAMKVLHAAVADDDAAVARFRREAKLAAQLAHPAIVPIYDWETRDGISWYTMELAEGGSLASLVHRNGPQELTSIAEQVDTLLDALGAAHAAGVVHRDLKPENVLIDRNDRWRLTDFGIAHGPGGSDARGGGTGTPEFAAPEQLLGEPQGASVDLFGMGAILAFALTGRPPYGSGDPRAIVARAMAGAPDLDGAPEAARPFLRRALSARPEDRFPDADAMRDAWRDVVAEVELSDDAVPWWSRWLGGA